MPEVEKPPPEPATTGSSARRLSESYWDLLSNDEHRRILLSFNAVAEVAASALVCRHWRAMATDDALWGDLLERDQRAGLLPAVLLAMGHGVMQAPLSIFH